MRCPYCKTGIVEVGADGQTYCPECMRKVENAEFSILKERMSEQLDEFLDAVGEEDRELALEFIHHWLCQKAEVY